MTRRLWLPAALLAVLAGQAAAAAPVPVLLRLNDGFVPKGTNIVCAVEVSRTLVPGAKLLDCFIATRAGAVPNTYTVALAVNGEAALGRVDASGKVTVLMKRGGGPVARESGSRNAGRVYEAVLGSTFVVKGTSIACAVVKQTVRGTVRHGGHLLQDRRRRQGPSELVRHRHHQRQRVSRPLRRQVEGDADQDRRAGTLM